MRRPRGLSVFSAAAAATAAATAGLLAPTSHAVGVVRWDLHKRHQQDRTVERRTAGYQQEVIDNSIARGGYFATCTVGTPAQDVVLQLDTGSSDIWIPWRQATVCEENACSLGNFNPQKSSTYDGMGTGEFEIAYVDGSYAKGDYFTDVLSIADATVSNMTMGLGKDTTIPYGVVGVGYMANEAIITTEESLSAEYTNLPALMVSQGLIATNAYSLWLNDLDANTGSILFGGIDTQKYVGDLTRIPILEDGVTGQYDAFLVELTSVHAVSSSGTDQLTSSHMPVQVVLDSGTTLSYLPQDMAQEIWQEVGAVYSASMELAVVPCRMQKSTGYLSFTLAGTPTVKVRMDELVLDIVLEGPAPTFTSGGYEGEDVCEFGIQNATETYLLGDTFLRSAYVVYDLINNEIGIAPTDFNATGSNIVTFASQGAVIPSATLAPNQSLATGTATPTQPAFAAEAGFSNGTSDASPAGVSASLGLSSVVLAVVVAGGTVLLL